MEMDNDLLTLWLKARDGLPRDDARALIEQLQETRHDKKMAVADWLEEDGPVEDERD